MAMIDGGFVSGEIWVALNVIAEAKSSLKLIQPLLNDKEYLAVKLAIRDALLRLDEIAKICGQFTDVEVGGQVE